MNTIDKCYVLIIFCLTSLKYIIELLAVLIIIWIALSWHDVVKDNLSENNQPISEGNFFVEMMEVREWFE